MISESAHELKAMIEKAIDDHLLTREEYDKILFLATKDGVIDRQEQVLLEQLQEMISNRTVKLVAR